MFVVVYKKYNPYKTQAKTANKGICFRSFTTEKNARDFANKVNTVHIINPIGEII